MSIYSETFERPLMRQVLSRCSELNIPVQMALELTYRCNLRCSHCYIDLERGDELTLQEWKDVLDQLKAEGAIYLLFTGGEIMVRPDFLEIAAYARRNGFIPGFLTNSTLVTPGIARDIADLRPFSVGTSLHGAAAATHEQVTRVPGSFEKTLEGIRLLINAGLEVIVHTLVMKSNVNELNQIEQLVELLGAKSHINMEIAPTKTGANSPLELEPEEEKLALSSWRPAEQENVGTVRPVLCKAGKSLGSISPNGDVFPCIMFPLKLGNVKQTSFSSIWRTESCAELRYLRSMTHRDLHACNDCGLKEYCQRCTGIAYLESGHSNGISPSACKQAMVRWRLSQAAEVIE